MEIPGKRVLHGVWNVSQKMLPSPGLGSTERIIANHMNSLTAPSQRLAFKLGAEALLPTTELAPEVHKKRLIDAAAVLEQVADHTGSISEPAAVLAMHAMQISLETSAEQEFDV